MLAVSALGTVIRYLGQTAGNDQNRWTPSAARGRLRDNARYRGARDLVDRITVATPAQGILYARAVTADLAPTASADAQRAIEAGRAASAMTSRKGERGWVSSSSSPITGYRVCPVDTSSRSSATVLDGAIVSTVERGTMACLTSRSGKSSIRSMMMGWVL